jgi:hypothetical protein
MPGLGFLSGKTDNGEAAFAELLEERGGVRLAGLQPISTDGIDKRGAYSVRFQLGSKMSWRKYGGGQRYLWDSVQGRWYGRFTGANKIQREAPDTDGVPPRPMSSEEEHREKTKTAEELARKDLMLTVWEVPAVHEIEAIEGSTLLGMVAQHNRFVRRNGLATAHNLRGGDGTANDNMTADQRWLWACCQATAFAPHQFVVIEFEETDALPIESSRDAAQRAFVRELVGEVRREFGAAIDKLSNAKK